MEPFYTSVHTCTHKKRKKHKDFSRLYKTVNTTRQPFVIQSYWAYYSMILPGENFEYIKYKK